MIVFNNSLLPDPVAPPIKPCGPCASSLSFRSKTKLAVCVNLPIRALRYPKGSWYSPSHHCSKGRSSAALIPSSSNKETRSGGAETSSKACQSILPMILAKSSRSISSILSLTIPEIGIFSIPVSL